MNKMEQANTVKLTYNNVSEIHEVNFNWKIPNYQLDKHYSVDLKLKDGLECTLKLVPKHDHGRTIKNFVRSSSTVVFTKVPDDGRDTWFSYNILTKNSNYTLGGARFRKVEMSNEGFIGNRNNLSTANWKQCLDKVDLSLNLDVKFIVDEFGFNIEDSGKGSTRLPQDFSYDEIKYPDITLVCANNENVPANKAVLAARSPVFAKILTDEIDTYVIEGNSSKDNVMSFLQFLYTDIISVDKFKDSTIELMELASKYEVSELVNICQQYLLKECKAEIEGISMKMKKLSNEEIVDLDNFAEINRCIKNLYRCTKDIYVN